MRVNVYHEEFDHAELVTTTAENTGITYYGARLYLKSAPELHHTAEDDDRSAVTLWLGDMYVTEALVSAINAALDQL